MSAKNPYVRHDAQIGVGLETEHGTPVAVDRTLGKVVEAADMPDPTVEWQEERSINGRNRELTGKEAGRNTYDGGSLTVLPVDEFPFEYVLGNDADGDGVIEVSNAPLPDDHGRSWVLRVGRKRRLRANVRRERPRLGDHIRR